MQPDLLLRHLCKNKPNFKSALNQFFDTTKSFLTMNQLTSLGKYIFLVPFFFSGVSHLMGADGMTGAVPSFLPGGVLWVYLTGAAMLAFVIATFIGKFDKLAAVLLGILMLVFAFAVHLPQQGSNPMWMVGFLKDLGLAGGAFMMADKYSRDNSIIG